MNVKVLPMPAGEDPDSYAKSHSSTEFLNYIEQNEQDFVVFKTTLLLKSTKNDPIKRAEVIKDVVSTISIIPDKIMRSVYIKECATLLNIKEDVIYQDIKDRILSKNKLKNPYQQNKEPEKNQPTNQPQPETNLFDISFYELEKELITYLLRFGEKTVKLRLTGKLQETTILDYIHSELKNDDLILKNQIFKELFDLISETYTKNKFIDISEFTNSTNNEISASAINIISNPFTLSKIHNLPENRDFEEDLLPDSVPKTMLVYKIKIVVLLIEQIQKELKNAEAENNFDNVMKHLNTIQLLNNKKSELAKILGRIIL
jgi:DNA primase